LFCFLHEVSFPFGFFGKGEFYFLFCQFSNKFLVIEPVPENTPAGEYFYEGVKNLGKTERVYAEDWFELKYASERRRGCYEYCIYQENLNQVISLIWEK
jgi:hypothetical protein